MRYRVLLAALAVICASTAHAQSAGSNVVGAGWVHLAPQSSSRPLTVVSPASMTGALPGTAAELGTADTLGLTVTHFLTDNWALSMDLGVPPVVHLYGRQALQSVGELGSARQWSPTNIVKYYFGTPASTFRPFLGAGFTYVWFSGVQLSERFEQTLSREFSAGADSSLRSSVKVDSQFAPVFSVGASYRINDHWGVAAAVSYIPFKTTAHLQTYGTPHGTVASDSKLTINPIVGLLEVTYLF